MEQTKREQYHTRWGLLKSERSSWFMHWQELSNYCLPRNGRFFDQDRNKGYKRHNSIYDNTGIKGANVLAAGMMAGMTSPARPWFRLATQDPDMMKSGPTRTWLADVTTKMQDVFQRSNTYRALHQIYLELGVFGTAASVVQEDYKEVVRHYPLTIGEYAIATDFRGQVCTMYREFQKTVGELVKEFGYKNCSNPTRQLYDKGSLDVWITIIHAIEPNDDRNIILLDNKNKKWSSCYFELNSEPNTFLRESGYDHFPVLAPRWATAGSDIYGSSPAMEALGDVKQLQHEQLRKAQAIDFMTKPPLQVPTNQKNRDVENMPSGITYYDATSSQGGIKTLFDVRLDLSHLLNDIQDVRGRINSAFYADLFLLLANDNTGRMTATEVAERHEEKMLMLGPVLERLNDELLNPLIEMTFDRMLKGGLIPPPPPELQGQEINVEFVSMLAQAQKAIGTNSIDRFVVNLGTIASMKPEILDKFNADEWSEIYSDMLGVDPRLIVDDKNVAMIRQQRAQAQQQAQAAQQHEAMASMAQKLGTVDTGGGSNAAQDIMSNLQGYTGA